MMGKTHLAGGLAFGLLVERTLPLVRPEQTVLLGETTLPAIVIAVTGIALGALLPDIDEPNSMVSNLPKKSRGLVNQVMRKRGIEGVVSEVIKMGLLGLNLVTRAISAVVKTLAMGHRGATHWFVMSLGAAFLFALLGLGIGFPALGFWVWLGYLSHLLLDSMTLSGTEIWRPFSDRKFHLLPDGLRIRTGNPVDLGLGVVFGLVAAVLLYGIVLSLMPPEIMEQFLTLLKG